MLTQSIHTIGYVRKCHAERCVGIRGFLEWRGRVKGRKFVTDGEVYKWVAKKGIDEHDAC